jgi:site-specific DNA recombinase
MVDSQTAAIYLRVSSERQADEHSFGLASQQAACQAYADRCGFKVRKVYQDIITGTTADRVAFQQLITEAPHYDAVIVYAMDRLARSVPVAYGLAGAIAEAGVELHSALEGKLNFDDSSSMMFGINAVMSDAERRRIIARLNAGKLAKIRAGKTVTKLRKYGWKEDAVHPTESLWVAWIFNRALEVGVYTLMSELHAQGVPTPSGREHWDGSTLNGILRDPAYRGEWTYGRPRLGRRIATVPQIMSVPCPRIVSDELWYAVQRAMDERKKGKGRRAGRSDIFPLQGRISCAECGRAMVGQKRDEKNLYYKCGDRYHPKSTQLGCLNRTHYPVVKVHSAVLEFLQGLAEQGSDLSSYLPASAPAPRDVTPLLVDIDARLRRVKDAYEAGVDNLPEYKEKKAKLEAQRAAIVNAPIPLVPVIPEADARAVLSEALTGDLGQAAVRLGLRVKVGFSGALTVSLDPVL